MIAGALSSSCLYPAMDDFTPEPDGGSGAPSCNGDLTQDPHHCGRCGHDCLGGACAAGKCSPLVIADGLSSPVGVAVDDASVYWVTSTPADTNVGRAAKSGADRRTLYTTDTWRSPSQLAVDASHVFYASNRGAIVSVDKGTGAFALLAQDPLGPRGLALDVATATIVWVDELPGLSSASTSGASSKLLARIAGADVALDATNVFVGGTGLRRIPRAGCPNASDCGAPLATGTVRHVVVDDAYLAGADESGVFQMRKDGGERVLVSSDLSEGVAMDREWVYWSTSTANGVVSRRRKDCALVEVLATGQAFPSAITVDDGAVYWCARGAVMKVAK